MATKIRDGASPRKSSTMWNKRDTFPLFQREPMGDGAKKSGVVGLLLQCSVPTGVTIRLSMNCIRLNDIAIACLALLPVQLFVGSLSTGGIGVRDPLLKSSTLSKSSDWSCLEFDIADGY